MRRALTPRWVVARQYDDEKNFVEPAQLQAPHGVAESVGWILREGVVLGVYEPGELAQ